MKNNSDRFGKIETTIIRILQLGCLLIVAVRILMEELSSGNSLWIHLLEIIKQARLYL